MTKQFTPEEQNDFYNKQPAKRTGSPVLVFNSQGELLLVKPSYKAGWSLVGGVGEKDESPLVNAARETGEEIGVELRTEDFAVAGIRYVSARNGRNEEIQTYFKVTLTDEQAAQISIQNEEIEESRFVLVDKLGEYADTPRIQAVVAAIAAVVADEPFYLENETRIL